MRLRILAPLVVCGQLACAQSSVDTLVDQLEFYGKGSLSSWKYSTEMAGDPTQPGFDDSRWKTLTLGQRLDLDSCWMRTEVVLPDVFLGSSEKGTFRFSVTVDDYGYLFVNGNARGKFLWDGTYDLSDQVRPGQRLVVAIRAINTGGPLRLLRASLQRNTPPPGLEDIEDLSLSFQAAQKLLSTETYRSSSRRREPTNVDLSPTPPGERRRLSTLLQETAAGIDVDALRLGKRDAFHGSVVAARTRLAPIRTFVKQFTLFFDANAHIDAAWLWRSKETIEVCKRTFASVLNMMQQRPDFTYTQSSAAYYAWMRDRYPDLFAGMARRIRDGRWEIVGGMWVEPDCNLPDGISWARHLLYGKGFFRKEFNADVCIGWNPDSFGYAATMPMLYRNAGIDAFITQKIGWNDTNVFPYRLFWWESPDGSRILSYFPFDYVNEVNDPLQLVDWLRQYEAGTGLPKLMVLFGVGDHGGGPSLDMLSRIDRLENTTLFPTIEHGTASRYLDWVRSHDLTTLPIWRDELYLEYHQGTFTTQAAMKHANRTSETLLSTAETFSSIATLSGLPYPAGALRDSWKAALFNQFHDILPGSSIREVYLDASREYAGAQADTRFELRRALAHVAGRVNTAALPEGTPLLVFNPLGWERDDIAEFSLPEGDTLSYAIADESGRVVPSQTVSDDRLHRRVLFAATHLPPSGYRTYLLRRTMQSAPLPSTSAAPWIVENARFAVTVDSTTGWVKGIVDKRTGRQLLDAPGNELQLLDDRPTAWDAWNIGWTGTVFPSSFRSARIVESGPVRTVVRLQRDYLKPGTKKDFPTEDFPSSFFIQDIILSPFSDRIEFRTESDWWEEHTMLKVAFPLAVSDTAATFGIPYGSIQRSTQRRTSWEKAKVEVPFNRWADVSRDSFGVSLFSADKYGCDITGNRVRLSLLRSPLWPDPTADRGLQVTRYALFPHPGNAVQGNVQRAAYEYTTPTITHREERHRGPLAPHAGFFSLAPSSLVLTSVKKAEESDAMVFQWFETAGRETVAHLRLPAQPARAVISDFLESDGTALQTGKEEITVTTPAYGVVTVKVTF